MKSIVIIIPYFGNFPDYFQLFLNSCKYNKTINWVIITDNGSKYNYPPNVRKVKNTFAEVQKRVKRKFDFDIVIDSVHKLCEYKPAYAYLFPELVEGYDYWGYGDLDLIYGDLRHFLTEEVLSYEKIFTLGHLTLIKNKEKFNQMFLKKVDGVDFYRKAFSSTANFNFDEKFQDKVNINTIFEDNDCKIWKKSYAADIYTKSSDFLLDIGDGTKEERRDSLFVWNKGNLYRYYDNKSGKIERQEFMYIHLQKRKMINRINSDCDLYKIIPNSFEYLEVAFNDIESEFRRIKRKNTNLQYFRIRFNNLKTKIKSII